MARPASCPGQWGSGAADSRAVQVPGGELGGEEGENGVLRRGYTRRNQ